MTSFTINQQWLLTEQGPKPCFLFPVESVHHISIQKVITLAILTLVTAHSPIPATRKTSNCLKTFTEGLRRELKCTGVTGSNQHNSRFCSQTLCAVRCEIEYPNVVECLGWFIHSSKHQQSAISQTDNTREWTRGRLKLWLNNDLFPSPTVLPLHTVNIHTTSVRLCAITQFTHGNQPDTSAFVAVFQWQRQHRSALKSILSSASKWSTTDTVSRVRLCVPANHKKFVFHWLMYRCSPVLCDSQSVEYATDSMSQL